MAAHKIEHDRQSYPSGFSRRKFGGLLECAAIHLLPCSAGGKGTSNAIFPPFLRLGRPLPREIRAGLIRKKGRARAGRQGAKLRWFSIRSSVGSPTIWQSISAPPTPWST